MPNRTEAEEHLRVIRSLMEKATIYRAISAPVALVGGLVSIVFGGWLYFHWRPLPRGIEEEQFARLFTSGWLVVLVITMSANSIFIWKAAKARHEPFISSAMRKALWALLPPILCGAFFTFALILTKQDGWLWSLPPIWMVCYGLGLLATAHFAPRSIPLLGWFFLAAGLLTFSANYYIAFRDWWGDGETHRPTAANLSMILTFGLFHLIYAACTWPRKHSASSSDLEP